MDENDLPAACENEIGFPGESGWGDAIPETQSMKRCAESDLRARIPGADRGHDFRPDFLAYPIRHRFGFSFMHLREIGPRPRLRFFYSSTGSLMRAGTSEMGMPALVRASHTCSRRSSGRRLSASSSSLRPGFSF
jgi:hypothetical protein